MFFKLNNKISKREIIILRQIIQKLPNKYQYLINHVNEDFILGKKKNEFDNNATTLLLNAKLENKFLDSNLPKLFIIKDIKVYNKNTRLWEFLELDILTGFIAGYKIKSKLEDIDTNNVDIKSLKEKNFNNNDKDEITKLLGSDLELFNRLFNINDVYRIDIDDENKFYVLKDYRDGNYLCMNYDRLIYLITHDPYNLEVVANSIYSIPKELL